MDQSLLSRILVKIGFAIGVIALLDLVFINYWVLKQSHRATESKSQSEVSRQVVVDVNKNTASSPTPIPGASPIPTPAPTAAPAQATSTQTVVQQTVVQTPQQIFIPIGSGSTTSNSYANLSGVQVTIDSSKYSSIASIYFEANLSVTGGNGMTYAQLYDSTQNHPVWFSQISSNSPSGALITSPSINLDPGVNTYVVQAYTTLNQYPANVSTARIQINLQ
jgi:hypothetical protein